MQQEWTNVAGMTKCNRNGQMLQEMSN